MSTPGPTEADVEALAKALYEQIEWGGCEGAAWHRTGSGIRANWTQAAERILASDWLAARDTEHQREVNPCSRCGRTKVYNPRPHDDIVVCEPCMHQMWQEDVDDWRDRADEARRELADLRAKVAALHGGTHWCFDANEDEVVFQPDTQWWPCPTYALLPTEDDQ